MKSKTGFSQLRWLPSLVAFPAAGLLARAVVGPVDDTTSALIGGLLAGAVLGLGHWIASRRLFGAPETWISVTAVGYGAGLAAGGSLVGFGTDTAELVAMGAVSGLVLGIAQGAALAASGRRRLALGWGAAMPALFALGWGVTASIGVDVERHHAIFGSSGALVFTLLSGLLLARLTRDRGPARELDAALSSAL